MSRFIRKKQNNSIYDEDEINSEKLPSLNVFSLIESLNSFSTSNINKIPENNNDSIANEAKDKETLINSNENQKKTFSVPAFEFLYHNNENQVEEKENIQSQIKQISLNNFNMDIDVNDEHDNEMISKLKEMKEMKRKILVNNEMDSSLLLSMKDNILNSLTENNDNDNNSINNTNELEYDKDNKGENELNPSETEEDHEYIQWEKNRICQGQGKRFESKEFSKSKTDFLTNRLNELNEMFKEYDYEVQNINISYHNHMNFQEKQEYKYESLNEKYNNYTNQLSQILDNINTLNDKSKFLKEKIKFYICQENSIQNELLSMGKLSSENFQEKNNDFYLSD